MADDKIIIVDNEADVLDLCERTLAAQGYQVKIAQDGREAIDLAQSERFKLLLTGLKTPGISGLEIAQAFKAADPGVICIMMAGQDDADQLIKALERGIDEFITKPFTPSELTLVIHKALETKRLKKENSRLRSLISLFELNKILMRTVEVDEVLHQLLALAKQETRADFACIYTFDQGKITHFHHQPESERNESYQKVCDRLAQRIFEDGQQLELSRAQLDGDLARDIFEALDAQAIIAVPLKSQNTDLGVLILIRKEDDFSPTDSEFLAVLSGQTSIALENARLFTKIQEAYQELQTLDDMKSEFINIAAHELRTPLAILMGYTTVLEEEVAEEQREYLNHITRNALRLRSLIDDMLSMQYLESGLASLSQDDVDLHEVVDDVIKDMSLMAGEKNLKISVDIPDDFPEMIADRYKIDLILMNLFHNAIKFTPEGGQVTFAVSANEEMATMSVSNTGSYIPDQELNHIFDRFYQIGSSLTREHGGIGLGLAIVKGMVEACGGQIRVESDARQGTTFIFTLPLDNSYLEEGIITL